MKGYFWIFLKVLSILLVAVFIFRFIRKPNSEIEFRKAHIANEIGYDNFLENLSLILPEELSDYNENLIYKSESLLLFQAEFSDRIRIILHNKPEKEVQTIFPFLSENVNLHFQKLMNGGDGSIDQTELTFVNIEGFNKLLNEKEVCNSKSIIEEFFELRSLGGTPHEVLTDFESLNKTQHKRLASQYYNENSNLGDTIVMIRFKSEVDNKSRICQYGFLFDSCEVDKIQFTCLEE
ncbi:hypothetical protein SAMN05421640_2751 [Ekhidna lutea]|uniref:Uncharacterized protein n=1 Tax=Ekhidna lutea TaxID=447679 RepID=A0A239KP99_EKHLU|nr:hypothetical protein [Ekhidna lutea]SNT19004.1 hypothetical protein SAMN05421640_2751 [Ekhidna lutea]